MHICTSILLQIPFVFPTPSDLVSPLRPSPHSHSFFPHHHLPTRPIPLIVPPYPTQWAGRAPSSTIFWPSPYAGSAVASSTRRFTNATPLLRPFSSCRDPILLSLSLSLKFQILHLTHCLSKTLKAIFSAAISSYLPSSGHQLGHGVLSASNFTAFLDFR
ncbi:hypothetical protein C1H46_002552 [Malus baccata]|uniref:Uncharacterized protein n=1 Tax=Malus baccata TaxID=106549 RepID=A0A540NLM2_MALBA|nr:hypothetical protein C1H46_002552 [Malus baccata]